MPQYLTAFVEDWAVISVANQPTSILKPQVLSRGPQTPIHEYKELASTLPWLLRPPASQLTFLTCPCIVPLKELFPQNQKGKKNAKPYMFVSYSLAFSELPLEEGNMYYKFFFPHTSA